MKALVRLLNTSESTGLLVLRLALGGVMLPHGLQKTFGLFGGHGFSATMEGMTSHMGIPAFFVFLAITAEFAGSIGLILGLLTRVAAFGIFTVMVVAIAMVHGKNGFFMADGGFEYHLLAIGMAVCLMIRGGGFLAADKAIARRIGETEGPSLSRNV